jgi:hypothetical protein
MNAVCGVVANTPDNISNGSIFSFLFLRIQTRQSVRETTASGAIFHSVLNQAMDELLKKDVGQDSRFYAMGVGCGQAS